jgi:hypothetical protein
MDRTDQLAEPDALARLERSRLKLAQHLARGRRPGLQEQQAPSTAQQGIWGRVQRASRTWWNAHPLHDAVDVARPVLHDYAERRPMRLLGVAAGTGAAIVLLRKWRMLPVTGLVLALIKSSDMKALAHSLVAPAPSDLSPREEEARRTGVAVAPGHDTPGA